MNKTPELGVAKREELPLETSPVSQGITIEAAFNAAASKALDKESLDVMKQLLAMDAERKFNIDFVRLMSALPTIVGARAIPDRNGNTKFEYASFDDIDEKVRPICQSHGFCYSFKETGYGDGRVTTTMMLTHIGGHTREIPCTVRIGQGPPGTSEAQNDLGAHTFGKRGALEMGLSLRIIGKREDAKMEGNTSEVVTPAQAEELERRVFETNSDRANFLKFAGATKFSEIQASKYDQLDQLLRKKESAGR